MAIIYTYPVKLTAANDDLIIITDSEDENLTKQVKVSSLPGGSSSGVNRILAGNNIQLTPSDGIGNVTVSVTGGNTGTVTGTGTFNTLPKWDSTGAGIEDSMSSQSADGIVFSIKSGNNAAPSVNSPTFRLENTSIATWAEDDIVGAVEFFTYNTSDEKRVNAYIKNQNKLIANRANGGLIFGGSFYNSSGDPTISLHELGSLMPETNQEGFLSGNIFTVNSGPYQATSGSLSVTIPKIRTKIDYDGTWDPYQKISEIQFFSKKTNESALQQAYINVDNGASTAGIGAGEISFGVSEATTGSTTIEAVRIKGDTTTVFERNMPLSISVTGSLDASKTVEVPQQKELTGASGTGLQGLLTASAVNTGNLIVKQIGNGRYVDGETLDVTGNFLYTDGTPITTLTWTVNVSTSKGDVILQGDLYDSKLETGTSGQVLKSLGTNQGIFWDTLPTTTGTVTEVDSGTGMVTTPSTGIITTGSIAIQYTGAQNAILSATTGSIGPEDKIWFSATASGNIEKGLVSDLINQVTAYTAGTGILLSGNQFSLDTPISVANGGTGLASLSTLLNANVNYSTDGTGILPISHGGSNNSSIAINSIFHSGPTSNLGTGSYTAIETTAANNNYVLTSNGANVAPSWKLAPSSNVSIGTSGVSSGLTTAIISETSLTGAVLITSNSYNGGNAVGHVPSGGTSANVYLDGTGNWSIPAGSGGGGGGAVDSVTTTNGVFIDLTPTSAATGAVTVTADLSATGSPSSTTFLRGDNQWAAPSGSREVTNEGATVNTVPLFDGTEAAGSEVGIGDSLMTESQGGAVGALIQQMAISGQNIREQNSDCGVLKLINTDTTQVDSFVLNICSARTFTSTENTAKFVSFKTNLEVVSTGGIHAVATNEADFFVSSDYRLKQNIKDYKEGLHNISNLRPVTYQMKSHPEETLKGFIAHEVQEYIPSAVSGVKDGVDKNGKDVMQTLSKGVFMTDVVSAIKELKSEVDSLKAEIKSLQK